MSNYNYPDVPASSDNEILQELRSRFATAIAWESNNRAGSLTAFEFRYGDQWPVDIRRDRESDSRPCITVNLTDAMVRRVSNALRENCPRIKAEPVDNATVDTAKVVTGLIRHIENCSGADYAYDTAGDCALTGGLGYIGITTDYVDSQSFDQEVKIEAVRNPFRIYFDPASVLPDGSDAQWCIESDMVRRDEYQLKYGTPLGGWTAAGSGDNTPNWTNKEEIRVAKYWRIEHKKSGIVKLSDGRVMLASEYKKAKSSFDLAQITVADERETIIPKVMWYMASYYGIISKGEWPGKYIPMVPVYGRTLDVNGRLKIKGMVEDLMDPARMYNYSETAKTEAYALQPRAPWLGAEGFMDGHEGAWRDANRKPIVGLEYAPTKNVDGTPNPPPMRQSPPALGAGFQEWSQTNQSNFMAVAGMPHDPNQDAKGEVVSGVALRERAGLADISHYDFYDNLTRSLRHLGKIILDLLPHIYDTERMQRIVMPDGRSQMVPINQKIKDEQGAITQVLNDITTGRYDIVMDTGPGYKTARQESAAAKLELLATPLGEALSKEAGDIILRSFDWDGADEMADRLAAQIPAAQQDMQSQLPAAAQTIIKGLQGQLQQAQQHSMALELELKSKHKLEEIKQKGELERTKLEIGAKEKDTETKAHTQMFDTHVRSTTARDVAEIQSAATLMNTHAEAGHEKELASITAKAAEKAEKSST